ncbi:jg9926, partial [Pararge aegeria aegeria]
MPQEASIVISAISCVCNKTLLFYTDDSEYGFDDQDVTRLDNYGHVLLHGKGYDRWFDKSFNLCFSTDGSVGFNTEHTWADAPVMGHLWEYVI